MCPVKEWFESFKYEHRGNVLLGDDYACEVKGTWYIMLRMHDGVIRILTNVRYIPALIKWDTSMGQIMVCCMCLKEIYMSSSPT